MPDFLRPVIHVGATTSTMDLLARLCQEGATPRTAVVADVQTRGRGRAGRVWDTPPGAALLMSVLLRSSRPVAECGAWALHAGLAVARTLEGFGALRTEIKWPNDVLIDGRKVAGVLISTREAPGRTGTDLLIGIGINVTMETRALPPGATSLHLHASREVSPATVLDRIDVELARIVETHRCGVSQVAMDEVNDRLAFRGADVVIRDGERSVEGWVRHVATDGSLVLEGRDGRLVEIRSGELTRGPRPAAS